MAIDFEVFDFIPGSQEDVYSAWLSSDEHSKMTGSPASVSAEVGGEFQAWDGYIQGANLELDPPRRILQSWRTTEFQESDDDSRLEITFQEEAEGTRITIKHSALPEHGMQYRQGWIDAYFTPMKDYFGSAK